MGVARGVKIFIIALSVTSCGKLSNAGEEDTPFLGNAVDPLVRIPMPPDQGGQSPQETPYCVKNSDGTYHDDVTVEMGSTSEYVWSQGGSCIFRPIREVWAVMHNQSLMVWKGISSSTFSLRKDPPSGVLYFYEVKYHVDDIINVDWTMNWYHSVKSGTKEVPTQILINYKKVKGTKFISLWEGSILLQAITPTVTAFTMRDQINASRTKPKDSADGLRDVHEKLKTGDPNWGPMGRWPMTSPSLFDVQFPL